MEAGRFDGRTNIGTNVDDLAEEGACPVYELAGRRGIGFGDKSEVDLGEGLRIVDGGKERLGVELSDARGKDDADCRNDAVRRLTWLRMLSAVYRRELFGGTGGGSRLVTAKGQD